MLLVGCDYRARLLGADSGLMLVMANGGPKGGSTWLFAIVRRLGAFESVPSAYQHRRWNSSSIDPKRLDGFLEEVDLRARLMCCKQHLAGEERYRELLMRADVRVLNIVREIRDVLVSRYFHDVRKGYRPAGERLGAYYWEGPGRENMVETMRYHVFWHGEAGIAAGGGREPLLASYERLHADFPGAVRELVRFIGIGPEDEAGIERVRAATAFEAKAHTGPTSFFRKGIVGDWVHHLSDEIAADVTELSVETGYDRVYRSAMAWERARSSDGDRLACSRGS